MEDQAEYETETKDGLEMFWNDKPKELPSVLSGFTPAPDVLIKKYGFVTALVWGRVWRYCQMSDGVCRATLEKIATEIGMSDRTIIRHVEYLTEGGYLLDTTPERRNKPHIYADTGKIRIRVSVEATMTESHSRVTESHREGDRESVEESTKKQVKKEKNKAATPKEPTPPEILIFREVTRLYPPKPNWESVVKIIQSVSKRIGRAATADDLRPFYEAWTFRGFKPTNINWTSWAVSGVIPQGKQQTNEPKAFEGIRQFLEEQNVFAG